MELVRTIALIALLSCPMAQGHAAASLDGTVLVADDSFTLEDVMEQVLVKQAPTRPMKFWIVVAGDQVKLATKGNGMRDPALAKAFDLVRQYGGIIYACETDMARFGFTASDLLPPAEPLKGFEGKAPMNADGRTYAGEDATQLPSVTAQLRRMRSTCSPRG